MSQYFPKPHEPFGGDIMSKLIYLIMQLKTEVDKLNIDKLAPVSNDLSKPSNVVKNDVKKTVYDKLVTKVDNIDTTKICFKNCI